MSTETTKTPVELPSFDLALWDNVKTQLLDLESDFVKSAKGVNSASVSLRKGLRNLLKDLRLVSKSSILHSKKVREERKAVKAAKKAAKEAAAATAAVAGL